MKHRLIISFLLLFLFTSFKYIKGIELSLDNVESKNNIKTTVNGTVKIIPRGKHYAIKIDSSKSPSYAKFELTDGLDASSICFKDLSHCQDFVIKFWFQIESNVSKIPTNAFLKHGPAHNTKGLSLNLLNENNIKIMFDDGESIKIIETEFIKNNWNWLKLNYHNSVLKGEINGKKYKASSKKSHNKLSDISDEFLVLGFKNVTKDIAVTIDDYRLELTHTDNEVAMQDEGENKNQQSLVYSGQNYIKYNFKNKIKRASDNEELDLTFNFKDDMTSGLIWYSESGSEKSYIFLKDSRLYYIYMYRKTDRGAVITATEEIFVPQLLAPNKIHKLVITRVADRLTLTVDEVNKANKVISVGTSPLLHPGGLLYVGGHPEPALVTNGKMNQRFRGSINKIQVTGEQHEKFDLISILSKEDWRNNVQNVGDVKVDFVSQRNYANTGDYLISSVPVPFTFTEFDKLVRFSPWDFEQFESIEIQFRTKEPRGVLLFVGPDNSHTDYVCIEFFDRNLYLAFGSEAKDYRIQLNPKGFPVTTGNFHTVFIKRDRNHKFTAKFDDRHVDIGHESGHQRSFGSYTYIGGIDNPTRLPWYIWSREGFVGCLNYMRVNEEKYIDPRGKNNQYSGDKAGVDIGKCLEDVPHCTASLCEGGFCHDRTFPYLSSDNYYCDCGNISRTYRYPVSNIRRSEACVRNSEIISSDGSSFYVVDFKSEDSRDKRMKTHTDDISINFKTDQPSGTIFQTYRTNSNLYFALKLRNGYLVLETNMNDRDETGAVKQFQVPRGRLNDNQWHTVNIKRRAEYISMYVDDESNSVEGNIPVLNFGRTFDNVFEYIFVGSNNLETTNDKLVGEFRNFYWNEFDFFGTRRLAGTYRGTIKTPKPVEPPLPPYPRDPPVKCTMTHEHKYTHVPDVAATSNEPGFFIEFKTKYNGVIWHAYDTMSPNERYMSLIVVDNQLVLVYQMNDDSGVKIVEDGSRMQCSDNNWHRILVMIHKNLKRITFLPDKGFKSVVIDLATSGPLNFNKMSFYFGGMPRDMYNLVFTKFRIAYPRLSERVAMHTEWSLVGCLGEFLSSENDFKRNLLSTGGRTFPLNTLDCSGCKEPVKCVTGHCKNGGSCYQVAINQLGCNCTLTGFTGNTCSVLEPRCPRNYCLNGGRCVIIGNSPQCDCTSTGYRGARCQESHCTSSYCYNGGICRISGGRPTCFCDKTQYTGRLCQKPICPDGYCQNNGRCIVQNGQPVCDCRATGYLGGRCEQSICTPNFCNNGGRCIPRDNRPTCECLPEYYGPTCLNKVCSFGYCYNGGTCYSYQGKAMCRCKPEFEGSRCEIQRRCPDGYCMNNGRCYLSNGNPYCDCRNTDFQGDRCEITKRCPQGYCQNGGTCLINEGQYVCRCLSGFRGEQCQDREECPNNYCLNNGICTVQGNEYICNCFRTGYGGSRCSDKTTAILSKYDKYGYVIYDINNPLPTTSDSIVVGFQTYMPSGTIYTFKTTDNKYWLLKLENGRLVIDVNGKLYQLQTEVNDGRYHIVSAERRNGVLLINLRGQQRESVNIGIGDLTSNNGQMIYNQIILGANNKEVDIFKGAVGGFNWNGKYVIDEIRNGKGTIKGKVEIIVGPTIIDRPPTYCPSNYCKNNGLCVMVNYQPICRCENTGFFGERCSKKTYGIFPAKYSYGGYLILNINPPKTTHKDTMKLLFQAFKPDNPVVRFELVNGKYYEIIMIGGQLYLTNSEGFLRQISNDKRMDNGNSYFITFERNRDEITFFINGQRTMTVKLSQLIDNDGSLTHRRIVLGADQRLQKFFQGALGDFEWNGNRMIGSSGQLETNVVKKGKVTIILMPYINGTIIPPKLPKKEIPNLVPGSSHGGVVWTGSGIFIPGIGIGGGAIVPSGVGPAVLGAGVLTTLPVRPLIGGLLLAGLLLTSALIWACWRCKPGCCPCCAGLTHGKPSLAAAALTNKFFTPIGGAAGGGAGGAGAGGMKSGEKSFWSKMKSSYVTNPAAGNIYGAGGYKSENIALVNSNGVANGMVDQNDFHTTTVKEERFNRTIGGSMHSLQPSGGMYGGNIRGARSVTGGNMLDANDYRFGTIGQGSIMRIDTTHHESDFDGRPNVFAGEEMKVDCCVLSHNSQYAVTGSDSGPPQVWDMQSGELFKVMDGMEIGCTDLHLACNDRILVGLVADEHGTNHPSRLKRLQMWDFTTGSQIGMPGEIMCSASCISYSGDHLILNRENPDGGMSILVWNIEANQPVQEIQYDPSNFMNHDGVTFLKMSHDDKMVVAGFTGTDEQAQYMVFDLSASYPPGVIVQPLMIQFDAKTSATEIIGTDEAITGTKNGELIVWNLKMGKPVRKIALYATLEGNIQKKLDPHKGAINCVVLSNDGQYLVTGSADQTVNVYTMSDERLMHTLEGHADDVLSAAISLDNEIIVSGSWDGSMRVWNLQGGTQMCWFTSNIEILQVKLTNDKKAIVALGERMGMRKLIMLQIIRNRSRRTRHTDGTVGGSQFSPVSAN